MEELKAKQLNEYLSLKISTKQKTEMQALCKENGYTVGKFVRVAIDHLTKVLKDAEK